jgi:hypothetical protein
MSFAVTKSRVAGNGNGNGNGHGGHLVALLPRGEAIRNFVYTGALDEVASGCDLTVVSVLPSQPVERLLRSRYNSVVELQHAPDRWAVRVLREMLDMAHGRWLWSVAAQERWRLRDLEVASAVGRAKRLAKKLACYPFAHQPGLQLLSKAEGACSWWLRTTEQYVDLFRKIKPSFVFNGSHVHSNMAMQAVHAARRLGIPTGAFIFSWDNLTSQGRIMPMYDFLLVWNEAIRRDLLDIYPSIRPEQVFVTGTPQFDFHFRPEFYWSREEFCGRIGADPARPIVLYSTGMANHMPGEEKIVEGIAAILRTMPEQTRPQLMVRIYPKDDTGRFEELRRRCPDILFPEIPWDRAWLTPRLEDSYLLTNMLRHAAVGINVASTVSLELCMFDKPVINVGYNPPGVPVSELEYALYYQFDHYRPVVESGAVRVARSETEMRELLTRALDYPNEDTDQRKKLVERMFGATLDGKSASRAADHLLSLARSNSQPHE